MTFGRSLFSAFAGYGDRTAIVSGPDTITFTQAMGQVRCLASNLRAAGVRHGDYVGLAMVDTADVLLSAMACWLLTATPVIMDFRSPRSQRAWIARDFDLVVVLESDTVPDTPYPAMIYERAWRHIPVPGPELPGFGDDTNPAFLLFSSGTTGTPKAYVQTHERLKQRIDARREILEEGPSLFLTPMALTYSATRHHVLGYLARGGTVHFYPPLFSPSELTEALLSARATGTALPPSVIARLAKEAGPRSEPLFPSLNVLASVGGPARPADKVAAYRSLSPGYRMSYASTLTGTIALLAGPDVLARPEAAGRVVASARAEIVDIEGRVLPLGEAGLVKAWTTSVVPFLLGPGRKEYVDPATMGPGWGIPGDIGFLDADGFVTLIDRQADMIVRDGVNVAPQELEKIIAAHPKVQEVAVVGFADDIHGQEIAAFIVTRDGTVEELRTYMRAHIAPEKRPREIRLVPELPLSPAGKLMRRQLAEQILRERSEGPEAQ